MDKSEVDTEVPYDHTCGNELAFLEAHQEDVLRIQQKLMSLRKEIRIELAQWFLARDAVTYEFTDMEFRRFDTKFSSQIKSTHWEYGKMMYPKKAPLCGHCGHLVRNIET